MTQNAPILKVLETINRWVRSTAQVVLLCRFSVLSIMAGLVFLVFVPQGQEVLRMLAGAGASSQFFFAAAALIWSLGNWYWARVMLSFRFADWPPAPAYENDPRPATSRILARLFPRGLGSVAMLSVAVALFHASTMVGEGEHEQRVLIRLSAVFLIASIVFLLFVIYRRRLFRGAFADRQAWMFDEQGNAYEAIKDLKASKATVVALLASVALTCVLFILFTYRPANLQVAPFLGSATILLAAAAAWVPVGSFAIYLGHRYRFPILCSIALCIVVFSMVNDNHAVHQLKAVSSPANPDSNVAAHFARWVESKNSQTGGDFPVYVVAAEGGGIRAAYWTASVLGTLQDHDSDFASHVYVISGVSGGSLGAAVFAALVASDLGRNGCNLKNGKKSNLYKECAQAMLSDDFLAPTLATMLYPDLVQRFLPFPINYFDRGRTLEAAWEQSWNNIMPETKGKPDITNFASSFDNLWRGKDRHHKIPSLILNSTQVETGKRVLMSNLPISSEEFSDVSNVRMAGAACEQQKNVPMSVALSTAAHNSARFTYVSPGGKICRDFHLVDGGYFENSGSSSALEILRVVEQDQHTHTGRIVPIVIHISNDPLLENIYPKGEIKKEDKFGSAPGDRIRFGEETLTPVMTLFNTRGARAIYSTEVLARESLANKGRVFHFGLKEQKKGELPLGWSLSETAIQRVESELVGVALPPRK